LDKCKNESKVNGREKNKDIQVKPNLQRNEFDGPKSNGIKQQNSYGIPSLWINLFSKTMAMRGTVILSQFRGYSLFDAARITTEIYGTSNLFLPLHTYITLHYITYTVQREKERIGADE
jgi:hypothetical protein